MLEALQLYKRDWAKVTRHVGTRSAAQVRSHAQKYFDRVARENSGEFVPQPRPKRKSATPYPRKPRDLSRPASDDPQQHTQQFQTHNPQHHPLSVPVPLSVRMSPIANNPYSSNGMVNSHMVQTPAASPVMPQIPPSYLAGNGTAISASVPGPQLGYINAQPTPTPPTPMTPLSSCGAPIPSGNLGLISPITPFPSTLLPSPQGMPSQMVAPPGHMAVPVQIPMGVPIPVPTAMSRAPQQNHLYTSPINPHEQVQKGVPHVSHMMSPSMLMTSAGPAVTLAQIPGPVAMPSTTDMASPAVPMATVPAGARASVSSGKGSPQNAVISHSHPNNDATNCPKCQALQRFGGVLNEIRASTARRAVAKHGAGSKSKSGLKVKSVDSKKDAEPRTTACSRASEARVGEGKIIRDGRRAAKLSMSSKGVSKPIASPCLSEKKIRRKMKNGKEERAIPVEDASENASMQLVRKETDDTEKGKSSDVSDDEGEHSSPASPPFSAVASPSPSQARSVSATQSDGTEGEVAGVEGSASRSRSLSGDELLKSGKAKSQTLQDVKRNYKQNKHTPPVNCYSQQERREIYDAVQSLQILAERSSSP